MRYGHIAIVDGDDINNAKLKWNNHNMLYPQIVCVHLAVCFVDISL